jgi:hypothetical protein
MTATVVCLKTIRDSLGRSRTTHMHREKAQSRFIVALIAGLALPLTACDNEPGGDTGLGPGPSNATVEFVYVASTEIDPGVQNDFPGCVNGVGQTHIHPSWRNFSRIDMMPVGEDRWEISFSDVPTGELLAIRVSDPNTCAENPTGASTENVFANDVRLTNVVDTPGSGIEPGLSFTVMNDGTVLP